MERHSVEREARQAYQDRPPENSLAIERRAALCYAGRRRRAARNVRLRRAVPDRDFRDLTTASGASYTPTLNNLRGILWMLLAVTTLSTMFVIIKQMTLELPVFVVAIFRTCISLMLLMPWLARNGMGAIRTTRLPLHFGRAFCGITAFVCVVFSLQKLILADAMTLTFTSPFWSILISVIAMGEVIRGRRIAATVIGFCGVLMVVKPEGGIQPAMLLALLAALLTSFAMVSMKKLSSTEPPTRVVFYFMLFGTLVLIPPALLSWQTPTAIQFAWLFAAGTLGVIGQAFLARAYDAGEISIVAPFDFMRLPISAVFGFLVFAEVPDLWSIAGTVVIIASAVYLMRRGAAEQREARAASKA